MIRLTVEDALCIDTATLTAQYKPPPPSELAAAVTRYSISRLRLARRASGQPPTPTPTARSAGSMERSVGPVVDGAGSPHDGRGVMLLSRGGYRAALHNRRGGASDGEARSLVGLDVHATKIVAAVLDGETGEVQYFTLGGDVVQAAGLSAGLPRPVRATHEAGRTGYGLARELPGRGVGCVVAAPSAPGTPYRRSCL